MRYFLVTGCGRSGTRFASDLLTAYGARTSWEGILNPMTRPEHRARDYIYALRKLGLRGDSNWLAVPYLKRIPADVIVFHQIRHPLKVIRSLLALRFFGDDYLRCGWRGDPRHTVLPAAHLPGLRQRKTAVERCMHYWVGWNRLCEQACRERGMWRVRYQMEELIQPKTKGLLDFILSAIETGRPRREPRWPKNKAEWFRADEGGEFTWDDLPEGRLKEDVRELAKDYGYGEEN